MEERQATFYQIFFIFATLENFIFNIPELVFNLKQGVGYWRIDLAPREFDHFVYGTARIVESGIIRVEGCC